MKRRLGRKLSLSLEEIEREAQAEMDRRISLGKPPPEDWKGLAGRTGGDVPIPGRPANLIPPPPPRAPAAPAALAPLDTGTDAGEAPPAQAKVKAAATRKAPAARNAPAGKVGRAPAAKAQVTRKAQPPGRAPATRKAPAAGKTPTAGKAPSTRKP